MVGGADSWPNDSMSPEILRMVEPCTMQCNTIFVYSSEYLNLTLMSRDDTGSHTAAYFARLPVAVLNL